MLWDVALVQTPVGEEFSTSVWVRCKSIILRNLGSYLIIAIISVYKANSPGARRADHMSFLNWLDDISSAYGQVNVRPTVGLQALVINVQVSSELI